MAGLIPAIVEQYFGISHLHDGAKRVRFTDISKNSFDACCRQVAFNITRGIKFLRMATGQSGGVST